MLLGDAAQPWPGVMCGELTLLPGTTGAEIGDPSGVLSGGMNGVFGMVYSSLKMCPLCCR
jgi:hypothetical protein